MWEKGGIIYGLSASVWKKDGQLTASPRNTVFSKRVSAGGAVNDGTVRKWVRAFREECETDPDLNDTKNLYEENCKLRREPEENKKETAF